MTDVAQRMMELFLGHGGAHGTHGEPDQDANSSKWAIKKTARTVREPVTLELWAKHLSGEKPLGIICIREDCTCVWGSIDIDKYDEDLSPVVSRVAARGLPLVPCRSKSGGLHLFLFMSEPVPAGAIQSTLRDVAASLGLAGSEIFPKQTQVLSERGDLGNWMVMPYFGGTYNGKLHEQVGLTKSGADMSVTEFLDHAEKSQIDCEQLALFAGTRKTRTNASGKEFGDGPPCLQHLVESGIDSGGRNNVMFHMGIYFKKRNPQGWKEDLEEANRRHMRPPMAADEVVALIRSLDRREYEYTCKNEPMASHCDTARCRSRKFGVGNESNFPVISGLSKLNTTPVIWFVDVNGQRLEVTTEQLGTYSLFHKVCMDVVDVCYGSVKQDNWFSLVNDAMKNLTIIEATPDVGIEGRFHECLEEFLTNRQVGERREDLLNRRPWEDAEGGKYYFRLGDLMKFLNREDMRDERGQKLSRVKASRYISRMNGEAEFMNIKGHGVRTFWVPSSAISKPPSADDRKEEL